MVTFDECVRMGIDKSKEQGVIIHTFWTGRSIYVCHMKDGYSVEYRTISIMRLKQDGRVLIKFSYRLSDFVEALDYALQGHGARVLINDADDFESWRILFDNGDSVPFPTDKEIDITNYKSVNVGEKQ